MGARWVAQVGVEPRECQGSGDIDLMLSRERTSGLKVPPVGFVLVDLS